MNHVSTELNRMEGEVNFLCRRLDAKFKKLSGLNYFHHTSLGMINYEQFEYTRRRIYKVRKKIKLLELETKW